MKQNTDNIKINLDNPKSQKQILILNGINRMSDLIDQNSRDMRNQLMFLFTVLMGILIGYFIAEKNLIGVFVPINFLLILTIYYIRERKSQEKQFLTTSLKLIDEAHKESIKLPGVDY